MPKTECTLRYDNLVCTNAKHAYHEARKFSPDVHVVEAVLVC